MHATAGTRFGPYEVLAPLGAGGMGEVYRARDVRLDRSVALKVLAPEIAGDPAARARFEREARAIAALDHPHICGIHDVGEAGGTHYLVMPLLEGQTLAARLEKGRLPLEQALAIAAQVADALDTAHRHGIVHRDLKPGNIMLTKAGAGSEGVPQAKLLDFGLAKLRVGTGPISMSTIGAGATTAVGTAQGTILGTLHYMAPEQVEGRDADPRTDIWALGAVLYEMLTGVRPFQGETPASVVGAILKDSPVPVSARQFLAPPQLDRLVAGCLTKDPEDRWQSARDVKRHLHDLAATEARSQASRPVTIRARSPVPWLVAAVASAAVVGMWWIGAATRSATAPAPVVRFQLTLPVGLRPVPEQPPAVSPDGQRLALVAIERSSGRRQIYLRALDSNAAQVVSGTLDAEYPFWSADGRRLAFFARTRLRTIDLASGEVQDLAPAPNPGGPGVWIDDEIWHPRGTGPVVRVAVSGGVPRNAAPLDPARGMNQSLAGRMPDGRLIVGSQAGTFLVSADGQSSTLLTDAITTPAALFPIDPRADGSAWVLTFVEKGRLMAQALDRDGSRLIGQRYALAPEGSRLVAPSARPFSAGGNVLAFVGRSGVLTRPTWVDRGGRVIGPAASVTGQMRDVQISPNGRMLSVSRFAAETGVELLVVDVPRDTVSRVGSGLGLQQASWTSEGQLVAVAQQGTSARAIFRVAADEAAVPQLVLKPSDATASSPQESPDGKFLCYGRIGSDGDFDIYVRETAATGEGHPLLDDPAYEASCRISPDGRFMAYHSNETGVLNVFVRSFPDGRGKTQVSIDGGQRPTWRADGSELYYLTPDGALVAAGVTTAPMLAISRRESLFMVPVDATLGTPGVGLYAPSANGQRFVMLVPTDETPQSITVILNWRSLLQELPSS